MEQSVENLRAIKNSTIDGGRNLELLIEKIHAKISPLSQAQERLADPRRTVAGTTAGEAVIEAARQYAIGEAIKLYGDSEFRLLKLAFAAERNVLPPGQNYVKTADGARIKVVVKEGTHVTLSCVDALVARVAENGVVPTVLEFDLLHGWLGSATESGKITIRTRAEDVNYMFTFDHESGHVYDFALDQKSPDYHNFIEEWKSIVRMNGDVLFEQAGMGGDKRPAGGRDEFIKNIIDNPRFLGDSDGHAISYYASSSELIGEMFALYMHEQRLRAAGRKVPGYWILLSGVVSPRDQRRAEVMFNFPELYHHLKQTLFFKFSAQRAARARMLVPHAKGESPAALLTKMFTEHGGNSREFRTTYEMLQNESIMKAREALADSMFALNHGINPEGFDAKKLSAQNAQTYENYRRFVQTDYQAHLDKSIPSGQREQIERAHRLFNETVVDLESRTNVVLRDLLESRR